MTKFVALSAKTYSFLIDEYTDDDIKRERHRERQRETDRQTERDRERQRDRETERERQRERQRETETQRDRETERETERQRETERSYSIIILIHCLKIKYCIDHNNDLEVIITKCTQKKSIR